MEFPPPGMKKLLLRSYDGMTYRLVSTKSPRDCTSDEIPVIDLANMSGDLKARQSLGRSILQAAEKIGFFYIENHGISEEVISNAYNRAKEFFRSPTDDKRKVACRPSISAYGYREIYKSRAHPTSSLDRMETFSLHYHPQFDPMHQDRLSEVPDAVLKHIPDDMYIWDDIGVSGFKDGVLNYYQCCLALARRLIRIIALALDLPEDYFDSVTAYPGGDFGLNFYPGHGEDDTFDPEEVGLGAHTDLQIFTLLWQDQQRGLQVINNQNEWIYAPPLPGTFVVNIGDFLMRLTNDRLRSTVHRVIQHSKHDRYSMPFFFGFNFNERLGVIPTCVDENNPAKYEPATCGEASLDPVLL